MYSCKDKHYVYAVNKEKVKPLTAAAVADNEQTAQVRLVLQCTTAQ